MKSPELMHLNGKAHCGEDPPVAFITAHPTAVRAEYIFDKALHGFDPKSAFFVNAPVFGQHHNLLHFKAIRRHKHCLAAFGDEPDPPLTPKLPEHRVVIGLGVHGDGIDEAL